MPTLVAGLSGLLVGRYLHAGASDGERTQQSIAAMLLLYWVPVLAFAAVAVYAFPRALLFMQPLGAVLVAAALRALAGSSGRPTWSEHAPLWQGAAAVGLALLLLTDLGTGLRALGLHSRERPDPIPAYRYVAAHHVPGEPIVVDWPPFAYFVLGDSPDLRFMVGAEWRFGRYTRPTGDARLTDMFLGTEAVASVADLCELLAAHPGSWLVPDVLGEGPLPEGSVWSLVQGTAEEVFPATEGVSLPVFRSVAPHAWTQESRQRCQSPGSGAEDPAQGGNASR
jgi:hypothetical protein